MLPLKMVLERDIDLLILEEFHCSEKFQNWFIEQTVEGSQDPMTFLGAWHSVTHSVLGESDIEVEFQEKDGCKLRVLIENKIDALVQPEQIIRYGKRGQEYLNKKMCQRFVTVLICPAGYLEGFSESAEFDSTITYESLKDWFNSQSNLGVRGKYKASVLSAGIEEARRGYQPLINNSVTDFWMKYWKLATLIAPELQMPQPSNKPERAGFIVFKPVGMPSYLRIVHKLGANGRVDLEFSGMALKVNELKLKYEKHLTDDMNFAIAGKSAAIRIRVPAVKTVEDFDNQIDSVRQGIDAAKKLYGWIAIQKLT